MIANFFAHAIYYGITYHEIDIHPSTYNLYFFVNKNDKIKYTYNVGITLESAGSVANLSGVAMASGITPSGIKMEILECCVY